MDLQLLENIIRLAEQSALSVLELECDGMRVRMEKPVDKLRAVSEPLAAPAPAASAAPVAAAAAPAPAEAAPEAPAARKGKELNSPMVGTFHFIKGKEELIGKSFKKGEAVCTIEAMKLMNEITMEEDGAISWVAVAEGEMVEFGQLLLMYE